MKNLQKVKGEFLLRKNSSQKNQKGFTLIELLVVIAIIGILAEVLFVAVNPKEQNDKAKAAKIANDLKQIQKAFEMTTLDLNRKTYPTESELSEGSNPSLTKLSNAGKLKYLSKGILTEFDHNIFYDNDGDIANLDDCTNGNWTTGANLVMNLNDNTELIHTLDILIDRNYGPRCGKIRWSTNTFTFNLSDNK